MNVPDRLRELACNLYWTWNPDLIAIFRDLDPDLWRDVGHNPVEMLDRITPEAIQERTTELALEARISQAFHRMRDYLESVGTWGSRHAGPLRARPVAYFSAEFGLHESLPIYSGGLGVLAGDHLKVASDLDVPLIGVGLFYAKGYFHQRLDPTGWQQEEYFSADLEKLPLQWARDADGSPLRVSVRTRSGEIHAGVRTAQVGRNRLILLDSNVEENDPEHRQLTAELYGGDERTRIRQELLLGVGGLRALQAMGYCAGVIHCNEGHSTLAILELARRMMQAEGRTFEQVRERVAGGSVFTTHTPVPAGHDRFSPDLLEEVVGPLRDELGISAEDLLALGRVDPGNRDEPFCMTVLGLRMSRHRNAVSDRHGRVTRAMWTGLWPDRAEDEIPVGHITNGVHVSSWLAIPMFAFYARHLGEDWQEWMHESQTWAPVADIDEVEFWEQHQIRKANLVEYVHRTVTRQAAARNGGEAPPAEVPRLDPDVLTIGFARRFATYKRPELLLGDLDRLARLVNDPDRPVQILYAGKAHPNDEPAKKRIQRVFEICRDERFAGRVVFIENHDINVGRHLVQGVDVWLNTPRRPLEACGTSGQKVVLNGGLNLSVPDGWWAEACDGRNGWAIGCGTEHADPDRQIEMDRGLLFEMLEREVVPLYYDRNDQDVPHGWIARQKAAICTLPWRYSARRMLRDYTMRCYLPAAGAMTSSFRR